MGEMSLNFDVLRNLGLSAVKCNTEDEAQILIVEMFRQYPELVEKYWSNRDHRWSLYEPNTTYGLHIFDKESDTMQIANEQYWIKQGYTIVELKDLMCDRIDYGEFSTAIGSIGSLFGLEE